MKNEIISLGKCAVIIIGKVNKNNFRKIKKKKIKPQTYYQHYFGSHYRGKGWYYTNNEMYCPLCKKTSKLVIIRWMYDWDRCETCLVKLPLSTTIQRHTSNPFRRKKRLLHDIDPNQKVLNFG